MLMPNVIDYTDLRGRSGKVMEHLAEDPRIVTVRLDELGDEPEDFKVLYSILKFKNGEIIAMQDTIDSFLSESPAAGTCTAATLIGYNEFICGGKTERECWLSLGNNLQLPIRAGELPVHVNPTSSLNMCVMHVQYSALGTSLLDVEKVSIRMTPSIELRAHQDKCRICGLCTNRKACSKCKGAYRAGLNCAAHDDCHHCPEFKWQEGYGRQYLKQECTVVASILSRLDACTFEPLLSVHDACQRRFAFIVGNTQYLGKVRGSHFEPLGDQVVMDAYAICKQLKELSFHVHNNEPLLNQNKADLERELVKWTRHLPDNAEVLVFLSGHGMKLQGHHYFVPVNYTTHTNENVVEIAKQKCITLEWIQNRVLDLALRHEGLIMSFWDCCREDALEQVKVVRGSGSDTLIRNKDKIICKLQQKTFRSAGQLTVFASAAGALAHQDGAGGILAQALLAWWKDEYFVARRVGDRDIQDFVQNHIRRRHTNMAQQEAHWHSGGQSITFRFKEGVGSDDEQVRDALNLACMHTRQQQEEKMDLEKQNQQLKKMISNTDYHGWLKNKKSCQTQAKGSFGDPASVAIETETQVFVHGRGGIESVLRVLQDIADTYEKQDTSGPTRQFENKGEFEALVERVEDMRAKVVLRKLFLYRGQCSVMQEIWIEDKQNPDAIRKPLKSYAIVHVHHHVETRETRVNRVEDIKAKHLDIVDAINARHLAQSGARYQGDNPFFQTFIEPSGSGTIKIFPKDWTCSKCQQTNFRSNADCRGREWRCSTCR